MLIFNYEQLKYTDRQFSLKKRISISVIFSSPQTKDFSPMPTQGRAQDQSNLSRHNDSKTIKSIFKNSVGNKAQLNRPDLHEFSVATAPVFLPSDAAHIWNSGYIPWITPTLVFIFIFECINTQKSAEGGEQCQEMSCKHSWQLLRAGRFPNQSPYSKKAVLGEEL